MVSRTYLCRVNVGFIDAAAEAKVGPGSTPLPPPLMAHLN